MIVADAKLTTSADHSSRSSNRGEESARREVDSRSAAQRCWLARSLLALCKNLYYLRFALTNGLAAALWRGCTLGREQAENALCWKISCPTVKHPDELLNWLRQQGLRVIDAEHALYLPPQDALQTLFPEIASFYPPNCGFKILKDLRSPAESNYLAGRSGSVCVRRRLTGSPAEQLVTANYMHTLGIGPRVWDVCCWQGDGNELTVFVVDHVAGTTPTDEECRGFLNRLRRIAKESYLKILMPRWETQDDFASPACRGNLITAADDAGPQYVDFQNFRLRDPAEWARDIVDRARRPESEGWVADVSREAAHAIVNELRDLGIRFRGRVARHLDCGLGELLHAALNAGASWVYGSTTTRQQDTTTANLFSQGAGRFTIVAEDAVPDANGSNLPVEMLSSDADDILFCQLDPRFPDQLFERLARHRWKTLVCLTDAAAGTDASILSLLRSNLEISLPVSIAHTHVNSHSVIRLHVVNKE